MRKIFACAATIAFLGAVSLSAKGEDGSEYAQGKTFYQEKCQMCHGEKGEGNGPMGSAFSKPPANFTKPEFWKNNPDKRIMNAVENGYKMMPPIDLTPEKTEKVIYYISHTFKK